MASKCYICDTGCGCDPQLQSCGCGDHSGTSSQRIDTFTRFVLGFPASTSSPLVQPSPTSLSPGSQLTFCPRCVRQLNRLHQMEHKIRNLQAKCDALKENLLSTTLSTIIASGLQGSTSGHGQAPQEESRKSAATKGIGQLATKIAKQQVLGFRIYRKWKRRFVKELKKHLSAFKPLAYTAPGSVSSATGDQTFAPTNANGQRLDDTPDLNVRNSSCVHSSGTEDSNDTNSQSFLQFDHSYSSKAVGKSAKFLHAIRWKRKITSSSFLRRQTQRKPKIGKPNLKSESKPKATNDENFLHKEKNSAVPFPQNVRVEARQDVMPKDKESVALVSATTDTDDGLTDVGGSVPNSIGIQESKSSDAHKIDEHVVNLSALADAPLIASQSQKQTPSNNRTSTSPRKAGRSSKASKEKRKTFECDKENCKKLFNSNKQLQIHKRIHGGEKKYLCDTCGSLFLSLASLHSHRKTHLGLKPYKCQTCQRSFRSAGHLSKHSLIHSGEKPFSCSVCDKLFNRKENLRVHEFTHSAVKPYKCTICNEAYFTQPNLLRKHVIQKHLPPAPSTARRKHTSRPNVSDRNTSQSAGPVYQPQPQLQPATFFLQYSDNGACEGVIPYGMAPGPEYGLVIANEGITTATTYENGNDYVQHAILLPDGQYLIIH